MASVPEKTIFDNDISEQMDETSRGSIPRPVLIRLDDADMHQRYNIDRPEIILGRDMLADIAVNDTRCSRRHLRIEYANFDRFGEPPEVYAEDMGSTNGTYHNGVRMTGRVLLNDRDKILIGSTLFTFSVRDQNELQADQRLLELATLDALTGLYNRGMFNREMSKEFDRARRYKRALSLVLLDIDHFKRFNDSFGHQLGDFVLQEMGRLVRLNQRSNDVCTRYGGEEFALILPETHLDGALINAERLRVSVANNTFRQGETRCQVTISLGIASQEPGMESYEELVRIADKALYQAKALGRNCICYARGGEIHSFMPTGH